MNWRSTHILRLAIVAIGIPILALYILLLPRIAAEAIVQQAANGADLSYVVLGILLIIYIAAIPFYLALYQVWKLLKYIDNNEAFSDLSVRSLRKIRNFAAIIGGLYIVALPLVYIVADWDDAPGLILMDLIISGASIVMAVFAAVLKKLLQQAIHIKAENDLTV